MAMSPNLEAKSKSNPIYKQINGAEGGFTPLHIAVCQAQNLESCRHVRMLLLKGASRDTMDD